MSAEPTSHDPENQVSFIKTPRQLITLVVLAFVVPIVVIIMLAKTVWIGRAPTPGAMTPEAIAARIKPVADVAIAAPGAAPGAAGSAAAAPAPEAKPAQVAAATPAAPPAAAPPAAPAPAAAGGKGKETYDKVCAVCHAAGVAGAPKLGDKAAWAPRIKTGIDALHTSALKGKGAMPPKGGQVQLPDADVEAAVNYMVAAAK